MLRDEVIKAVKARLDEFSPFEEPESLVALPQSEVKPLDSIIENILAKAQDDVLRVVPLDLVERTVNDITSEANGISTLGVSPVMGRMAGDTNVGVMKVPHDFLRLHTAKFDIWRRAVKETYSSESEMYLLQRNPYTRGKTEKPIICINDGNFEVYSLPYPEGEQTHCTKFSYIPRTDEAETTFEDSIAPLVILEAARVCCEIFGKVNETKLLAEEEKVWLSSN